MGNMVAKRFFPYPLEIIENRKIYQNFNKNLQLFFRREVKTIIRRNKNDRKLLVNTKVTSRSNLFVERKNSYFRKLKKSKYIFRCL